MERFKSRTLDWLYQLFYRYFNDGCSYRAAYLAYLTLVCLVPVLAIAVTILSRLHLFDAIAAKWQSWLISSFLIGETTSIKPLISQLIDHALSMSVWHILAFLMIAILMMINIGRAFRSIWSSEARYSHGLSFLIYVVVLFVSPILLAVMFVGGGVLSQWFNVIVDKSGYEFLRIVFGLLSYVLLFIWFFLMNLILPACRVPLKAALFSGLFTTLFLWIARHGFSLFITYFSNYKDLYGSLSVIPIFLVWLYLSWMLILLGALIGQSTVRPLRG